jgi:hypothetical protein
VLSGLYRVGEAGLLDFSTQGASVVGHALGGGACAFPAGLPVVTGGFEGSTFVGSVLLCQEGAGCNPQRTVPLVAFSRGDRLVALVKLDRGCSSPAVTDRRLLFRPATPEEVREAQGSRALGAATPDQLGIEAVKEGRGHLEAGRFQQAREAFDVALRYDDRNYVALLGLGTSQVKLQEYDAALDNLQRAQDLARSDGAGDAVTAQVQYDLACVHARQHRKSEALRALAQAAALTGPELLDDLEHDPDLEPIRGEAEFRRLVSGLRARAKGR